MNGYTVSQIAGMTAIVAVLSLVPWVWKFAFTHLITLAHEYGHAFIGVFTRGEIRHIKIRWNSSGETSTARADTFLPLGTILTTLAGYPAPILLGAFLLTSVDETWQQWSTMILLIFGVFCFLFIRNFFGLIMALIWIAFFGFLAWFSPPNAGDITMWAGLILMVGGIRDLFALFVMWLRKQADGSDLGILKDRTGFPQIFTYILMLSISSVGTYFLILL